MGKRSFHATKSPYKRISAFSTILWQGPLPYIPTQSTLPHIFPYHLQITQLDYCLTTLSSHPSCITYFLCNCMALPPEASYKKMKWTTSMFEKVDWDAHGMHEDNSQGRQKEAQSNSSITWLIPTGKSLYFSTSDRRGVSHPPTTSNAGHSYPTLHRIFHQSILSPPKIPQLV